MIVKARKSRKKIKTETRGRKPNPAGKILPNGLFELQWKRIQEDAEIQGVDGAVLLRRIVDWFYDAKEKQEGMYSQEEEFKKLEKA